MNLFDIVESRLPEKDRAAETLETALNLWYVFHENGMISSRLARGYILGGTEQEKYATLRTLATHDWRLAEHFDCPLGWKVIDDNGNEFPGFGTCAFLRSIGESAFFEDVFQQLDALWEHQDRAVRIGKAPIFVITPLLADSEGTITAQVKKQDG